MQTVRVLKEVYYLKSPTPMMKQMGYGKDHQYDQELPDAFSGQDYFLPSLSRSSFYQPTERGFERELKKRVDYFQKLRDKKNKQ